MTGTALAAVLAALTAAAVTAGWALWTHRRDTGRLRAAQARADAAQAAERAAARRLEAVTGELWRLARERIPAAAQALSHPHAPVPAPPRAAELGPDAVRAMGEALDAALAAVTGERERVDAAARAAMRGATAKVQSLLYQIQSLLQELQHDNDDPRLLELDFRNELALRRIQATAVLCEAWPGLARTDSPLAEIVRGAQSRVPGYQRVKVANHLREERLGVVARAAEPLAIALAELLANATAYSHPETEVPVTLQQGGGRGVFVVIDDAGIGMDDDALARARRLLAGPEGLLLTELGNPPQAGFAVVGRLVRQYGFSCHVEPSPYGGVRAMLRVPASLLTVLADEHTPSVLAPEPVPPLRPEPDAHPAAPPGPAPGPGGPPPGADGAAPLPSRRRRAPRARDEAAAAEQEPAPGRTPEEAGARWSALQEGTRHGRGAAGAAAASGEAAAGGGGSGERDGRDDEGDDAS
ncbi:ATP-binding protein [Streptomyces sp. YIM 98790]|uniref:ATP-binding protein n=1 Tax=Streptomyces sp. YIM 98790 TaxID=2689077 RepID=UPI001A9F7CF7|nr:ATP-binding protein [Streptomyces sp. YIM 98790]